MRVKKEYVLRWAWNNEKTFPTLDKAKAFADEHVPDPSGRWSQPHAGEWYRTHGELHALYAVQIQRRKVTRKTPLAGQLQLYLF
jgi:hypothetical protein